MAEQDEQVVWVQVDNQGPAVSETDLEKIFEKFHRVTAADQITGSDFYRFEHREIFTAIATLVGASKPADVITVHEGTYRERIAPPRGRARTPA